MARGYRLTIFHPLLSTFIALRRTFITSAAGRLADLAASNYECCYRAWSVQSAFIHSVCSDARRAKAYIYVHARGVKYAYIPIDNYAT